MALPPFASIPPLQIRLSIAPQEWESCINAWLSLADAYLRLPLKQFNDLSNQKSPLIDFFVSFYHEFSGSSKDADPLRSSGSTRSLLRRTLLLLHRLAIESTNATMLIDWDLLSDICRAHEKSPGLTSLIDGLVKSHSTAFEKLLQSRKENLTNVLESGLSTIFADELRQLAPIMHASPKTAIFFMIGSDFFEGLISAHKTAANSVESRKLLVVIAYLGLISTTQTEQPNLSLLSDHFYSLKAASDAVSNKASFFADLVTNTPLIKKIRRNLPQNAPARLLKLLDIAAAYQSPSLEFPRKQRRTISSAKNVTQPSTYGGAHVNRLSLVTQVQDLLPDLGVGFVLRLLEEYDENVEVVTSHLLDNSLPPNLSSLDRSEALETYDSDFSSGKDQLVPKSAPPTQHEPTPQYEPFIPERRNIYDNDELDELSLGAKQLHIGKREGANTESQPNKTAILSALATFDSEDDERDDTYDVEDVGGTVDTAHPDGEELEPSTGKGHSQDESHDTALFATFKTNPELFGRTFDIRRGQARQALKQETGLTDEAIEGWAIMLQRDPRRLKRLEAEMGAFDGRQAALASTAYRESPGGTETEEDSDAPGGGSGHRGGFRGRGGRGRGRGRGGNVAGPSGDPSTVAAQRRKEANKGSRANHDRRAQRAKKMARGGFPG